MYCGFEPQVATFIKEFVVKLPEGETLNFKSEVISRLMYLLLMWILKI
jgi:Na+-transporting NADH:ubiquinone oxidoreductase subunit NqrF